MDKNIKTFELRNNTFYLIKVEKISLSEHNKYESILKTDNIILITSIDKNNIPNTSCRKIKDIRIENYIPIKDIHTWIDSLK
jgi:hypothetical protein